MEDVAINEDQPQAAQPIAIMGVFKPERFDVDEPEMWFVTFEANLRIYNVPKASRYDYLLCTLYTKARNPIAHLLTDVPDDLDTRYDWLRGLLITAHTKTKRQKLQQLLQSERNGDRKPTAFLAHLRQLAQDTVDDELIREFWWKELPSTARAILCAVNQADTRQLADAADSVYEELEEKLRVEAVRHPRATNAPRQPTQQRQWTSTSGWTT